MCISNFEIYNITIYLYKESKIINKLEKKLI